MKLAMLLKGFISTLTKGPDVTDLEPRGDVIHYKAKIDGLTKSGVEARIRFYSLWDLPPKQAQNITVAPVKRGVLLKEYLAEWDVRAPVVAGEDERRNRLFGRWITR